MWSTKAWPLAVVVIGLLVIGLVRLYFLERAVPGHALVRVTGLLEEEPDSYGSNLVFQLGSYRVVTRKFPQLHYGDLVQVEGEVQPSGVIGYPHLTILQHSSSPALLSWLEKRHSSLVSTVRSILPEPHASLVAGSVLGEKSGMPPRFRAALIHTGTIHVVVASGMNVSLILAAIGGLIGWLPRRVVGLLSGILILLYMGLVGFDPPIVRAGLMAGLSLGATALGRQRLGLWFLGLSAALMVAVDPRLWRSLSWQLSVMATLGILLASDISLGVEAVNKPACGLWRGLAAIFLSDFKTTLAAQLFVLPILVSVFHSLNLLSLVVNALVLWVIGPLTILGAVGVLVTSLISSLGSVFAWFLYPLAAYFVTVIRVFDTVSWTVITVPAPPWWVWILYYGALLMGMGKLRKVR